VISLPNIQLPIMTDSDLQQLKQAFVNDMIESMDMDTLISYAFDSMMKDYADMNEEEFREEIIYYQCGDEQYYNDLVEQAVG